MTSNLNGSGVVRGVFVLLALAIGTDRAIAQTPPPPAQTPPAQAADAAAKTTVTTGTAEIGIGNVSSASSKAGEYNGLNDKGAFALAAFDFRGGGAYDSNSAYRWRARGTDLGLDTRSLAAEAGRQGTFRVTFGYDCDPPQQLRQLSDAGQRRRHEHADAAGHVAGAADTRRAPPRTTGTRA